MWSQMFKTIVDSKMFFFETGMFRKYKYFFIVTKVGDWKIGRVRVLLFYNMSFCIYLKNYLYEAIYNLLCNYKRKKVL